ncbi:hypothetical protein K0504_15265 [Neiella marina]|uniref:Uncharacterized protein n=1 Tax=Neiella holothuriorum TaxID=2870530 RepID=A0ABS7EL31_9GAMM|nr:hypothetical protein [Neiella holothuriorum]MBW8192397.1 hypothetical protein [Neiella holothuriorum]
MIKPMLTAAVVLISTQATSASLLEVELGTTIKQSFGIDSQGFADGQLNNCYQQSIEQTVALDEWLAEQVSVELEQLDEPIDEHQATAAHYQDALWNDGQLHQWSDKNQLVVCHFDFQPNETYQNPLQQAIQKKYQSAPVSQVGISFLKHNGRIVTFSAYQREPFAKDLASAKEQFASEWQDAQLVEGGLYYEFAHHRYCELTSTHSAHCSFDMKAKQQMLIEQQPELYAYLRELVGTLTIVELERLPATAAGSVTKATYREVNNAFNDCEAGK